mmetsp:Transcript_108229/g.149542  ORF Transcript_108229/g.149542 Transcript_108229/m.149542 type:complete len:90 (+) Transcript_108229:190-459(+)
MQREPKGVPFLEAFDAAMETLVQHVFVFQWHPEEPVFSLIDEFIKLVDCLFFLKFDRLWQAQSVLITYILQALDTLSDLLEISIDSHVL